LNGHGPRTIRNLNRHFNSSGACGSRTVEENSFFESLASLGINACASSRATICANFGSGQINYDAFLDSLRGSLNQTRCDAVKAAWDHFSKGGNTINAGNLRARYNSSTHPGVVSGAITQDEAFLEFLAAFPDRDNTGNIHMAEWKDYYSAVS